MSSSFRKPPGPSPVCFLPAEPIMSVQESSSSNWTIPPHIGPARESLPDINDDLWLFGDQILISSPRYPRFGFTWSYRHVGYCNLSSASSPLTLSRPSPPASLIEGVYMPLWRIGSHSCRVKILEPNTTQEHAALDHVHQRDPSSPMTPADHCRYEFDGHHYLILSRVTGQTLTDAWPSMTQQTKQDYAARINSVSIEISNRRAVSKTGCTGQYLSDDYIMLRRSENNHPQTFFRKIVKISK